MSHAILFDDAETCELDGVGDAPRRLGKAQLLWIDVERGDPADAEKVARVLDLDEETCSHLAEAQDHASFRGRGRSLHITTYAPRLDDEGKLHAVECVVGERWVVTAVVVAPVTLAIARLRDWI